MNRPRLLKFIRQVKFITELTESKQITWGRIVSPEDQKDNDMEFMCQLPDLSFMLFADFAEEDISLSVRPFVATSFAGLGRSFRRDPEANLALRELVAAVTKQCDTPGIHLIIEPEWTHSDYMEQTLLRMGYLA